MWSSDLVYYWVNEHIDYSIYHGRPFAPDVRIAFFNPIEHNGNSFTEMDIHVHHDTMAIELHVGDQWRAIEDVNEIITFNVSTILKNQQFKFVVL